MKSGINGPLAPLAFVVVALSASAQVPRPEPLSESDRPLFEAEIVRVEKLLASAADKSTVTYEMARTYAYAKQWPETIAWLRRAAELNVGLDPSRDAVFEELRGTREFEQIMATVRTATPPVSHSSPAFRISEGDLVPESIAYDPKTGSFFLGSMRKGKVVRCSASGNCSDFAGRLDTVVGLKVRGQELWVLNNSENGSALIRFDLTAARLIREYLVPGPGHNLNDLAFAPDGALYVTDTRAGCVWQLPNGSTELTRLNGQFRAANGITLSPDGSLLFVSTFPDGITVVDLKTGAARPLGRPENLCLATVDGLYFFRGNLIAIQNGFMSPRVIRLHLAHDFLRIDAFDVPERRNPLFDGVTTGVIAGEEFFYMANIQDEKKTGFDPITILKLPL